MKPPAFFRQIDQDGPRFEQGKRRIARALRVDNGWNFVVRIERQEFRRHLVIGLKADQMRLVGQTSFLKHDRHFDTIRDGQGVELDMIGMARRPFFANGKIGKARYENPLNQAAAECAGAHEDIFNMLDMSLSF